MKISYKKAFSVIEYVVLFVIVLGAFFVMRNYIQRGVFGLWGQSGQSFSYGRQYDSQKTIQCSFDDQLNQWYDRNCYETAISVPNCNIGDTVCYESKVGGCETNTCKQVSPGVS